MAVEKQFIIMNRDMKQKFSAVK